MLRRKSMENLLEWKNRNNRKPLIISGARQVGKTYIVQSFSREYKSFIELNFIENPYLKDIFEGNLTASSIITGILLNFPGAQIVEGSTLIFFDEIQECPNAITALKFLAVDKRIDVIATGSALGMSYKRTTSFPVGSVEYLDMTALDFREFLWAIGIEDDILNVVREYYEKLEEVPESINRTMMQYLKQYMVIGGMPEVVNAFIEGDSDYYAADSVQRRIYRDYISDIARYAEPGVKIKAEACYKSIPNQLNKENHKFQYSIVEKKGTARKFESSIDWILNANMAIAVNNISYPEYPLGAQAISNNARIYPSDIGLLIATYDYSLKKLLISDGFSDDTNDVVLKTAKGGLYEALIADILSKNGHKEIYFYRNEAGTAELEFLIENQRGVLPIEVKAGKSGTKTLNNILKNENIKQGIKLSSQNVGVAGKKVTLPLYMAMFL